MEIERTGAIIARLQGKIGNTIYTRKHKQGYIARGTYKGEGESAKQKYWRKKYLVVDILYGEIDEWEREEWKKVRHGKGVTRYSNFMHVNLLRIANGLSLLRVP